jgi:hypothetical protein
MRECQTAVAMDVVLGFQLNTPVLETMGFDFQFFSFGSTALK